MTLILAALAGCVTDDLNSDTAVNSTEQNSPPSVRIEDLDYEDMVTSLVSSGDDITQTYAEDGDQYYARETRDYCLTPLNLRITASDSDTPETVGVKIFAHISDEPENGWDILPVKLESSQVVFSDSRGRPFYEVSAELLVQSPSDPNEYEFYYSPYDNFHPTSSASDPETADIYGFIDFKVFADDGELLSEGINVYYGGWSYNYDQSDECQI